MWANAFEMAGLIDGVNRFWTNRKADQKPSVNVEIIPAKKVWVAFV
jgi:hypothetical protein